MTTLARAKAIDWAARNANVDRINKLGEERGKLERLLYLLDLPALQRLNRSAPALTVEDLAQLIDLAETLAFWRGLEPVSGDVSAVSKPSPTG